MRRPILALLLVALAAVPGSAAQESLYSYVLRCAVGGAHLPGCALSDRACTFQDYLQGTCGATAEPDPPPSTGAPAAPTNLQDVTTGIRATHDGLRTEWYTLTLDGAYHTHVGMAAFVDGAVVLPLGPLTPGTYAAIVEACSDAAGCTASAPFEVSR